MPLEPVTFSRVVPASAQDVFDLLADPARHSEIDGSGMVQGTQPGTPDRLSSGAKFGMQMKAGVAYKILNEVVEFEEGRRIAWRHFGGHIWRYVLEPVSPASTKVSETFDPTTGRSPWLLKLIGASRRNGRAIERTLERLDAWARERPAA